MAGKPPEIRAPMMMPLEKRLMLDASLPAIAGKVLWLDAADATTIRDADGDNAATGTGGGNNGFAGTVATWVDKSGSGFNVTSTIAAERPLYASNTLNGKNVLTFDGTNDKLTNTLASIPGNDFTIFAVFNRTTGVARDAVLEIGAAGNRNAIFINEAGNNRMNYYLNGTFYAYSSTYTVGTYTMTTIMQDATAISAWNSGVSQISATGVTRTGTTGIYIGDDSSSGDQLQGNIAEIIIFDRDLTTDERRDVDNYLATKWGFTITNAAPTLPVNTGATVSQGDFQGITNTHLSASDTDNSETYLKYTITDLTDYGTLTNTNSGHTYAAGESFTQADIDSGYIRYTHNNSANFTDSFSFTISDGYSTTAASTFNITITPDNQAPTFQGWTLVSSEDFEAGATGWSINTTETSTPYFTRFLGRRAQEAGAQNTFKTYTLSGTQDYVLLNFDFYEIDSWDGESFRVFINDTVIFNQNFQQGTFNSPADGSSGIVSYTVLELTPFVTTLGYGAGFNDQIYRFTLRINTTAASLKLGFSSTLDQTITDEAWGVDNITIYEADAGGAMGPYQIVENSVNGTVVGSVTAVDPDVADTLSYSITGGTGAGIFSINPTTGVITVANSSALNYESVTSYTLNVRVTDNGTPAMMDDEVITINILNMPENTAPVIGALGPLSVAENAANNTVIGTASATDAESNTITWSITAGNTDNIFAINATTGAIRVNSNTNMNFEYASSYTLTIRAQDNGFGSLASTRNVTINITNVNEAPTFNIPQSFLNQNPYLRYSATTGNFYRYVGTTANYTTATTAAAAALLNGVAGHLATITSAPENTFVRGLGGGNLWLGASDAGVEGTWVWAGTGPEGGAVFSSGSTAQNGYYTNWLGGQPDNTSNEDHLEMQASGLWNDALTSVAKAYVIEWEGAAVMAALGNGPFTLAENPTMGQSVGFVNARDADSGDTLTYTITGGTGAGLFALNPSTGQITVTNPAAINYESATSYTLNMQVQDLGGLTATQTVTINISDVNETPVLNLNTGATLNEGDFIVVNNTMLSSSDVDAPPDSALIYTVTDAVDNGTLYNTNSMSALGLGATFTQGDIDNGYIRYTHNGGETTADAFSFTVSDGSITLAAQSFNFTVNPVNDAPVIQGWTLVSSETFESGATGWNNNTTETSTPYFTQFLGRASLDAGLQTNFKTYTLSGSQDQVMIVFDFYEIDSWDGEAFRVFVDDTQVINHTFSGSLTDNPAAGSSGAVSWTVQRLTPFSTNLGFAAGNADQIYRYTLTVNTTGGNVKLGFGSTLNEVATNEAWGVDNVSVYEVAAGGAPGPLHIAETTTNGTVVGTIRATDAELNTLTYMITGGTGSGIFSVNTATGQITVANASAINYESLSSYTLTVQVSDNGTPVQSDSETITIQVLDMPENTAPVLNALGPLSVAEDAAVNTVVGTASAIDAEGNTLTYSIIGGNTNNTFAINAATGAIRIASTNYFNYELLNTYTLSIRVTDNGFGALTDTRNVTINVTNVNEAPSFDPVQRVLATDANLRYNATTGNFYRYVGTGANFSAAQANAAGSLLNGVAGYVANVNSATENAFLQSLIFAPVWLGGSDSTVEGEWRFTGGTDSGLMFWLGGVAGSAQNGQYTNWNGGEPNNSGGVEDNIEMRTDGRWNDANGTGTRPYFIEWDGASVITSLQNGPYSIGEHASVGSVVGSAIAGDVDGGDTRTYSIMGGTGVGVFSINSSTGQITLSAPVNHEIVGSYTLTLRVQDAGGLFDTLSTTVTITDQNDVPGTLSLSASSITENSSTGTVIGLLSTVDEDSADTHSYSIISNPLLKFTIVGNELRTAGDIDYEQNQSFSIILRTNDGNGGTLDRTFTITVNDVLDTFTPPAPSGPSMSGESFVPPADTNGSTGINILSASLQSGGFQSFYGDQVLRENVTLRILGMTENMRGDLSRILEEDVDLFAMDRLLGLAGYVPPVEEGMDIRTGFTNLREALEFLQQMDESISGGEESALAADEKSRAEKLPSTSVDRRFVDVMTYHEERAARLRAALLS